MRLTRAGAPGTIPPARHGGRRNARLTQVHPHETTDMHPLLERFLPVWMQTSAGLDGRKRIDEYRHRRLRDLARHAYESVPYYRNLFERHGVDPRSILSVEDLKLLPVTTRGDLLKQGLSDRTAEGAEEQGLITVTTSGSSGRPLTVRRSRLQQRRISLIARSMMAYFGVRPGYRRASIAHMSHGRDAGNSRWVQFANAFGAYRHLWIDCTLPRDEICRILRWYRPQVLGGYPEAIAHVSRGLSTRAAKGIGVRIVPVGGEVLTETARQQIEDAFGARVFNYYASHEMGLIAWECRDTGLLHLCDHSIVTEVQTDGREARPGEDGEFIGTNLHSFAMPFLRYQLGDLVTTGPDPCPCGRPFRTLIQVQGRTMDYFRLPNGRDLHPYALISVVVRRSPWIGQYQFVQDRPDRIVLRAVPTVSPTDEQIGLTRKLMERLLPPEVELGIRMEAGIETGPAGKFRVARCLLEGAQSEP